jgi:hypothetical protein
MHRAGTHVACCALLVACGNGGRAFVTEADGGTGGPSTAWGADPKGHEDAGVVEPFVDEFDSLVQQTVAWADFDVTTVGARVRRGLDQGREATWWFNERTIYVEIDLTIRNAGRAERYLEHRNTWDLILADGSRVSPELFSVSVVPGDTAPLRLYYRVHERVDLTGSILELNGSRRGTVEPEPVPLDAPVVRTYPLRLDDLVGAVVEGPEELRKLNRHEIRDARVTLNTTLDGGRRAEIGKVFVELDVMFTVVNTWGSDYASHNNYRIIVDGYSSSPENFVSTYVKTGDSAEAPILFMIDREAMAFDLRFEVGYHERERYYERLSADLANTTLVADR